MMWHVVYAESGRLPQSRAAKSREAAIQAACELLAKSYEVEGLSNPTAHSSSKPSWTRIMTRGGSPD